MLPLADPTPPDFEDWYRQEVLVHERALRAYLRRAFPVVTDVDNLVQETFARVLQARRSGEVGYVRGYLFAVARNLALEQLRRRQIVAIDGVEPDALDVRADEPGVPDKVGLRLDLELLTEAMAALPERCREVLRLRKIDGLPQREIAARLGISEHTVEAQVANGMRRCAQFFRDRGALPRGKESA